MYSQFLPINYGLFVCWAKSESRRIYIQERCGYCYYLVILCFALILNAQMGHENQYSVMVHPGLFWSCVIMSIYLKWRLVHGITHLHSDLEWTIIECRLSCPNWAFKIEFIHEFGKWCHTPYGFLMSILLGVGFVQRMMEYVKVDAFSYSSSSSSSGSVYTLLLLVIMCNLRTRRSWWWWIKWLFCFHLNHVHLTLYIFFFYMLWWGRMVAKGVTLGLSGTWIWWTSGHFIC
jgi:hypothetical protein